VVSSRSTCRSWRRLYATAHGLYEPYLNGRQVGDLELTPGYTEYASRTQVQTYDVTALVKVGANGLGALLADHPDGTTTVVGTGEGWTSARSHIRPARHWCSPMASGSTPTATSPPTTWRRWTYRSSTASCGAAGRRLRPAVHHPRLPVRPRRGASARAHRRQWENGIVGNMAPMPPAESTGFLEALNGSAGWGDAALHARGGPARARAT